MEVRCEILCNRILPRKCAAGNVFNASVPVLNILRRITPDLNTVSDLIVESFYKDKASEAIWKHMYGPEHDEEREVLF